MHNVYTTMCCFSTGGILSSSLALATDAAHLLTDFASFMISLFALFMATRPATRRMSFGWHRAGKLTYNQLNLPTVN
jgi:Co/Zn/Cd efflux system component